MIPLPTNLVHRRIVGKHLRYVTPGYGFCFRCDVPWKFVESHTTPYGGGRGCFPLCQHCWSELTPEQRVPYYEQLLKWWHGMGPPVEGAMAEAIIGAALAGK